MTDIYVKKNFYKKKMPVLLLSVLMLIVLILLAIFASSRRKREPTQGENPPTTSTGDEIAADPQPTEPAPSAQSAPEPSHPARTDASDRQHVEAFQKASSLIEEGQLSKARPLLLNILETTRNLALRRRTEQALSQLHIDLIMAPYPMQEKEDYIIASGNTLGKLAKQFNTTVELIQEGNNIVGHLIRVGDRLRILNGRFSILVNITENKLILNLNNRFFKSYDVGTGKFQKTPTGKFEIIDRIPQPTWWRPDGTAVPYGHPDNVLGTHWLALNIKGYGIHGTWEPETIGKYESAGCIRLKNDDIKELYTLVPTGTVVVVIK